MCPASVLRLLECTALVRTQAALNRLRWREQTASTDPGTFWNVRHSVALLMNSKVTEVAEKNDIVDVTLAIEADRADGVLIPRQTP